ncbi:hypothetical protein OF829_08685 [Sphingomonas sp. LB-2]|uniref:hypothetical protein n=1 Tax=Sphingomonas caeni TaxID=2984949 RepID=UPI0022319581|nr:hypothetical protein [Sphingomonas caeni]MCW3847316.1 hypothetical protein [Sphingomonas caeni]
MLVVVIAAVAQAAIFAPPIGVPLRVVTERTEGDWTFRMERLVRFAREGQGYRAEVWMADARADGPGKVGAMMEAGFAGLAGRTMVFHLDGAGKLVAIDDLDALWTHFCDGIAAMVGAKHPNPAPLVAPIRALPPERRVAVLASLVTALVAEEAAEPAGVRPVRVPGKSPYGGPIMLTGTRSIARLGITLRSTTSAAADLPPRNGVAARVEMEDNRDSDPATGLISSISERVRTRIGDRDSERLSTVRVTLEPAAAWPAN